MTLTDEMKAQGWLPDSEIHNYKDGEYYEVGFSSPFEENEIIRGGIWKEWGNCADALEDSSTAIAFRVLAPVMPNTITISVEDARLITQISAHDYYTADELLQPFSDLKANLIKQLEAAK